eukprot:4395768-Prymnesium_polylepis.1
MIHQFPRARRKRKCTQAYALTRTHHATRHHLSHLGAPVPQPTANATRTRLVSEDDGRPTSGLRTSWSSACSTHAGLVAASHRLSHQPS